MTSSAKARLRFVGTKPILCLKYENLKRYEHVHEKTNNLGFRPGPSKTDLYSQSRWLAAGNFGFRK